MCELRKRGVPAAVIASDAFQNLGKAQSKVFGVPDLPLAIIPHPLGGLTLEQVEGRAQRAIPQLVTFIREQVL